MAALRDVIALTHAGRLAEAEQTCGAHLARHPRDVEWLLALGIVLVQQGRPDAALEPLDKALKEQPDHAPAANAKGVALERLKRPLEAAQCYRQALRAMPSADIWFNLGNACFQARDEPGALEAYAQAVVLAPGRSQFLSALVGIKQRLCDWGGLDTLTAQLVLALAEAGDAVDPFRTLALEATEASQQAVARRWAGRLRVSPRRSEPVAAKDKITIGYLSADLHAHATAYLMAEFFELHDRRRFTVKAYCLGADDGGAMRKRLVGAFDAFVNCTGRGAEDVARRIAADGVDILVDLMGYTRDSRPQIMAHRPAPVQAQWIGYPGTMGAPFIDYVLGDGVVLPESCQPFYDEAIVRLPRCYQVNDCKRPLPAIAPARAVAGLPERGAVLACFNAPHKIRPAEFALWMRLLRQVEGTVLWLYADEAATMANLRGAAQAHGVAPERLAFAPHAGLEEHLARYRLVDLFLDTLPYNAHTTASDALWMGCPVVTRRGDTFAGRVGASLLKAVELERLVTHSAEEYESVVLRLLRDPAERHAIREHLDSNRLSLPLFDTPAAARAVERAYEGMWERAVAGLPPQPFSVAAMG